MLGLLMEFKRKFHHITLRNSSLGKAMAANLAVYLVHLIYYDTGDNQRNHDLVMMAEIYYTVGIFY